jgi:hypothetical protein
MRKRMFLLALPLLSSPLFLWKRLTKIQVLVCLDQGDMAKNPPRTFPGGWEFCRAVRHGEVFRGEVINNRRGNKFLYWGPRDVYERIKGTG